MILHYRTRTSPCKKSSGMCSSLTIESRLVGSTGRSLCQRRFACRATFTLALEQQVQDLHLADLWGRHPLSWLQMRWGQLQLFLLHLAPGTKSLSLCLTLPGRANYLSSIVSHAASPCNISTGPSFLDCFCQFSHRSHWMPCWRSLTGIVYEYRENPYQNYTCTA